MALELRMMRNTGTALLVFAWEASDACSCIPTPPVSESLRMSDAVLDGTVLAVEDRYVGLTKAKVWIQERFGYFTQNPADTGFAVRVKVHELWKGTESSELVFFTSRSSAECGYPFRVGERYLMYAFRLEEGSYEISLCTRTAPRVAADEDVSALTSLSKSKKF